MNRYHVDTAIKGCIVGALSEANNNVTKAVQMLGMSRATFYRKVKEYNITYRTHVRAK